MNRLIDVDAEEEMDWDVRLVEDDVDVPPLTCAFYEGDDPHEDEEVYDMYGDDWDETELNFT